MNVDFTSSQMIFIYGHFKKEIQNLEKYKTMPNCPLSKADINKEIKLYSSIIISLEKAYPNISMLNL